MRQTVYVFSKGNLHFLFGVARIYWLIDEFLPVHWLRWGVGGGGVPPEIIHSHPQR